LAILNCSGQFLSQYYKQGFGFFHCLTFFAGGVFGSRLTPFFILESCRHHNCTLHEVSGKDHQSGCRQQNYLMSPVTKCMKLM